MAHRHLCTLHLGHFLHTFSGHFCTFFGTLSLGNFFDTFFRFFLDALLGHILQEMANGGRASL